MHLNFEDDNAHVFNKDIDLIITNSGHYAIPLTIPRQMLQKFERNANVNITLSAEHTKSKTAIANKLHPQFAHPPPEKFIRLLNSAGTPRSDEQKLKEEIKHISKGCTS